MGSAGERRQLADVTVFGKLPVLRQTRAIES